MHKMKRVIILSQIINVLETVIIEQNGAVLSLQALAQENQQEAVSCVDRCKEMLLRLPKEVVCYKKLL